MVATSFATVRLKARLRTFSDYGMGSSRARGVIWLSLRSNVPSTPDLGIINQPFDYTHPGEVHE